MMSVGAIVYLIVSAQRMSSVAFFYVVCLLKQWDVLGSLFNGRDTDRNAKNLIVIIYRPNSPKNPHVFVLVCF